MLKNYNILRVITGAQDITGGEAVHESGWSIM